MMMMNYFLDLEVPTSQIGSVDFLATWEVLQALGF